MLIIIMHISLKAYRTLVLKNTLFFNKQIDLGLMVILYQNLIFTNNSFSIQQLRYVFTA